MSRSGASSLATMSRYLASDSCPWPRMALALVSSSCGLRRSRVGHVALAADRQQQRMHAGGIHGVDRMDAMHHRRNDRPGDLVDDRAEAGVLLRRPADHRERPDRVLAVIDLLDVQHRERMRQAVIAEVIAERPFGQLQRSGSTVPVMQKSASAASGSVSRESRVARARRTRRPPSAPANASSGKPSGNGITAASVSAGGPPTKTLTRNGTPFADRRGVMHADAAMNLIVQADLPIRLVLVARKLHAVHAEVGMPPAGPLGVLGVNLRQA